MPRGQDVQFRPSRALAIAAALLLGAWGARATYARGPIRKGSGAALCGALTQADFAALGLQADARVDANVQDGGRSAYCGYRGRSGAMGGLELDVFWPAGASPGEVRGTERTILAEDAGKYVPVTVAGADEALLAPSLRSGGPTFASIVVRRGDLVFAISLPATPQARAQLLRLSTLALARLT